jgi:hypothetical protein
MKFKLIFGILALALAIAGSAFGQGAGTAAPKLVVAEPEFNFGEVKAGAEIKHTFVVKNEGTAELLIKTVTPSCGCTASDFTKVIPPGGEGKITLTINTTGFNGAVSKHADVTTNDPQRPRFSLSMTMVIAASSLPPGRRIGSLLIAPSDRWSASIPGGSTTEAGIAIYNDGSQPVRITKVTPGGEAFAVSLDTLEDGKRYLLKAKSIATLPLGVHKQLVKLTIEGGEITELPVQLQIEIYPPVFATPKEVNFGALPVSKPGYDLSSLAKFAWIKQPRGGGLEIKSVSSTLPFIQVTTDADSTGQSVRLRIGFNKATLPPGNYTGIVKVETNNATVPVIEIPVSLIAQ